MVSTEDSNRDGSAEVPAELMNQIADRMLAKLGETVIRLPRDLTIGEWLAFDNHVLPDMLMDALKLDPAPKIIEITTLARVMDPDPKRDGDYVLECAARFHVDSEMS